MAVKLKYLVLIASAIRTTTQNVNPMLIGSCFLSFVTHAVYALRTPLKIAAQTNRLPTMNYQKILLGLSVFGILLSWIISC